jgi:hypothetical protein
MFAGRHNGSICAETKISWEFSQKVELDLPERRVGKQDHCFVLTHSARLAAGKQHRAGAHPTDAGICAVERNVPRFKIRARKPSYVERVVLD